MYYIEVLMINGSSYSKYELPLNKQLYAQIKPYLNTNTNNLLNGRVIPPPIAQALSQMTGFKDSVFYNRASFFTCDLRQKISVGSYFD